MTIENGNETPENGGETPESPILNSIDRSLWGHVGDLVKKFSTPKNTVESVKAEMPLDNQRQPEKPVKNERDDILSMIIGILQNMDKDEQKKFVLFMIDQEDGTSDTLKALTLKYFQEGYMELAEANRERIKTGTQVFKIDQNEPGNKLNH